MVENLASCGVESCVVLLKKGYPDIGWNPLEGERYLDFLKNAVFVNGTFCSRMKNKATIILTLKLEAWLMEISESLITSEIAKQKRNLQIMQIRFG